jgi:fatty acid desaturase
VTTFAGGDTYVGDMQLPPVGQPTLVHRSTYVRELRARLPPHVFRPATSRLVFIPGHLAVIALATYAIAKHWLATPFLPVLSLVIGVSFAGLTFLAHEGLHGGIVRGRSARWLVGWIGFLPFTLSPRLWVAWHNRVHHANANLPDDPDVYPRLTAYRASGRVRFFVDAFSLGGRRWRGALSLVLGFTVKSVHQLWSARSRRFLTPRGFRIAIAETLAGVAVWAVVAALVGFVPFLFAFGLPLLVANAIVMGFILTNHNLSPRIAIDDPMVRGLSVTAPRWVEWITLRFGFHVEHHLLPGLSSRHAGTVRDLLRELWPTRYQSMPLTEALGKLHDGARIYKDDVTLFDPTTDREYPTLQPQ